MDKEIRNKWDVLFNSQFYGLQFWKDSRASMIFHVLNSIDRHSFANGTVGKAEESCWWHRWSYRGTQRIAMQSISLMRFVDSGHRLLQIWMILSGLIMHVCWQEVSPHWSPSESLACCIMMKIKPMKIKSSGYLHKSHNTPLFPPKKICIGTVLDFSWDIPASFSAFCIFFLPKVGEGWRLPVPRPLDPPLIQYYESGLRGRQ